MDDMNKESEITWHQVHEACNELRKVMDGMIGQKGLDSFRPGIALAIAKARDEHQIATKNIVPENNAVCHI